MYSWIDGRKYSDSKFFPAPSFISKNYVPFVKNPFDLNNFKRLPVIKEEDGYVSNDEVQDSQNRTSSSLTKKPKYQSGSNIKNVTSDECKTPKKLPPLVNINCLMNTELKQAHSIWDTKFGRRLISPKNTDEEVKTISPGSKKIRPNSVKSCIEKFAVYQEPKPLTKRKTVRTQSTKADREDGTEGRIKKKSNYSNKNKQSFKKKANQEKEPVKKSHSIIGIRFPETPSRETIESSPTVPSITKNQRFLTECVQSILEGQFNKIRCEHCDESFPNLEELCSHKKQYEAEKEACLLCGKQFYSPNEFVQHLLTHEGVDRYSCKKCKKYFPNLRKYKQHCADHHFTPSEVNCQTQTSVENMKKWFTKFECKRCKIEFETEKEQEAHRRNHIRKDLTGAYLLSPKNI